MRKNILKKQCLHQRLVRLQSGRRDIFRGLMALAGLFRGEVSKDTKKIRRSLMINRLVREDTGYLLTFGGILCFRPLSSSFTTKMHVIWRRGRAVHAGGADTAGRDAATGEVSGRGQPSRQDLIQKRAELFHEHLVLRNNFTRRTT